MELLLIDNQQRRMAEEVRAHLQEAQIGRLAIAFVSQPGLAVIQEALTKALEQRAQIEFLVGLDWQITEPSALSELYQLSQRYKNLSLYCYASPQIGAFYHPKIYLFQKSKDTATCIIGSSNLTRGGLIKNIEANVCVTASFAEEFLADAYGLYLQLKFMPRRVEPDKEFVQLYEELCKHQQKMKQTGQRKDVSLLRLQQALTAKSAALSPPKRTKRDLVGWLDAVYDLLPEGEFTNQDVYRYTAELQRRFPQNRNIKAKIRQQLQYLRDMGFLEHLGQGHWRKL